MFLELHKPDHVVSHNTGREEVTILPPEPKHEVVQPGDTAIVYRGPYKGAQAIIEWMDLEGTQVWIYIKGREETKVPAVNLPVNSREKHIDHQVDYLMVAVKIHNIRVQRPLDTLTFSKEKGYDVCQGDSIEVMRGNWFRAKGVVQMVHFEKGLLDFMCDVDTQKVCLICEIFRECAHLSFQITVPITFCRKFTERSDLQLSRWVGRDVWVIGGDKKGYRATLNSLGRGFSWVALQGHQLIQLKNKQIATP